MEYMRIVLIIDAVLAILLVIVFIVWEVSKTLIPSNYNTLSWNDYRSVAMTGDILVFSSVKSALRRALKSPFSHTAMVVVVPETNDILVWESTLMGHDSKHYVPSDIFKGKPKNGPQLHDMEKKVRWYDGRVFIRQLVTFGAQDRDMENKRRFDLLLPMIHRIKDYDYESGYYMWPILFCQERRIAPLKVLKSIMLEPHENKKIFCSEMMVIALQEMNMAKKDVYTRSIMPSDLAKRKSWYMEPGYTLTDICELKC